MCTKRGGGIGVAIWELPNEKARYVIHHFKDISDPMILAEKLLNYFGSRLQGALKCLKCLFLFSFFNISRQIFF